MYLTMFILIFTPTSLISMMAAMEVRDRHSLRNSLLFSTLVSGILAGVWISIPGLEAVVCGVVTEKQATKGTLALTVQRPDGTKEVITNIPEGEYLQAQLQESISITRKSDFTGTINKIGEVRRK